jgi:hypothetical protein
MPRTRFATFRLAFLHTTLALAALAAGCAPSSTGTSLRDLGGGGARDLGGGIGPDLAGGGGGRDFSFGGTDLSGTGTTFGDLCPSGTSTTIAGTVLAPNGADPVATARVYIARQTNPLPTAVSCGRCDQPVDDIAVQAATAPDGTFTLYLDGIDRASQLTLVVAKGRFRRITQVPIACGANTVPATALTLPGKSSDGDIPRIAVGTGNIDHLDQVLTALGITEFTCLEGRKSSTSPATCTTTGKLSDLLTGQNGLSLADHDMVFIGCAPGAYANYATTGVSTATISQNLQSWVGLGGRLFVTDNSYDYLAGAFPQQLSWQGTQAMPWPVDSANVGVGGTSAAPATISATVDDMALASWLKVVGVSSSPMVTVGGILNKWSVMGATLPAGTNRIADGNASYTVAGATQTADLPLTTSFEANQCGKVVYSSYHTLSTVNQNQLSAQEKILEYLILDEAACTTVM